MDERRIRAHRDRRGGSLVKYLCFMAVLSIVAAVLIPGDPGWGRLRKSRYGEAIREIQDIETSVTKLLSDAGQAKLRDLFDEVALEAAITDLSQRRNLDEFSARVEIYTHVTYQLLRFGRNAFEHDRTYEATVRPELLARLGKSYMPDLDFDPWGNLYQVFPGPWPESMGPIVFRVFDAQPMHDADTGMRAERGDNLLVPDSYDMDDENLRVMHGWPTTTNAGVYIWSFGENGVSGQAIYDPTHTYALPAVQHYDPMQEPEYRGGGDDINNWDVNQTYMRWYN